MTEKLFLFQPLVWEWAWLLSIPVTFFGLSATKTTNLKAIKQFLIGTLVLRLESQSPLLIGNLSALLLASHPGRDGSALLRLLRVPDGGALGKRGRVARLPLLGPLVRLLLRCFAGNFLFMVDR